MQAWRIIKAAADLTGLPTDVSPTVAPHFGHYGQPRSEGRRTTESPETTMQEGLHAAEYMIGRIIALTDDLQDVLAEMAQAVAASNAEEVGP
jgi:hypothetical protein